MLLKSRSVTWIITTSGLVGLAGLAGCSSDRPHEVGRERPAVGDLDRRDRGQLQSRDLLEASDLNSSILGVIEFMPVNKGIFVLMQDVTDAVVRKEPVPVGWRYRSLELNIEPFLAFWFQPLKQLH